jgi:hypothetical protein
MPAYHGGSGKARACPASLTTGRPVSRAAFFIDGAAGGAFNLEPQKYLPRSRDIRCSWTVFPKIAFFGEDVTPCI